MVNSVFMPKRKTNITKLNILMFVNGIWQFMFQENISSSYIKHKLCLKILRKKLISLRQFKILWVKWDKVYPVKATIASWNKYYADFLHDIRPDIKWCKLILTEWYIAKTRPYNLSSILMTNL
jgi:hypothetical protein